MFLTTRSFGISSFLFLCSFFYTLSVVYDIWTNRAPMKFLNLSHIIIFICFILPTSTTKVMCFLGTGSCFYSSLVACVELGAQYIFVESVSFHYLETQWLHFIFPCSNLKYSIFSEYWTYFSSFLPSVFSQILLGYF